MVKVTESSDRKKVIVCPPKLMVPLSCGFSPKIASTICDDNDDRRRDCNCRANMSDCDDELVDRGSRQLFCALAVPRICWELNGLPQNGGRLGPSPRSFVCTWDDDNIHTNRRYGEK